MTIKELAQILTAMVELRPEIGSHELLVRVKDDAEFGDGKPLYRQITGAPVMAISVEGVKCQILSSETLPK